MGRIAQLGCVLLLAACSRSAAPEADKLAATVGDALKEQAFKDLQNDIALLKMQLGALTQVVAAGVNAPPVKERAARASAALYTCDRLALASKELSDDARAQAMLGEADSLCAYQAPLAASGIRLAALTSVVPAEPVKIAPADCGPIRDALNRVGAKYKNDPKLAELVQQFKAQCPKMRLGASRPERSYATAPSGPNLDAQRSECKRRCDDAAFSCRASCSYCGSCTTDKTWEWCNATCNTCRQGCEQNEKFCKASCGG
jgi:hypothetical protein